MHQFWGVQARDLFQSAKEVCESIRWKDCEVLDILVKWYLPVMIQVHKTNYTTMMCQEIEQMTYDSHYRRKHWQIQRFKQDRSALGHASGADCVCEWAVGECKPVQKRLGKATMKLFSRRMFLLTFVKRLFGASAAGRERGVRSAKRAPRIKHLLGLSKYFMNAGVCSEATKTIEWSLENQTMFDVANQVRGIGAAMKVENHSVQLSKQQLISLGSPTSTPGTYICRRAQALPRQEASLVLDRVSE
jgi:hypothetical protein